MPLHEKLGLASSCRASFYVYNTPEEIDTWMKKDPIDRLVNLLKGQQGQLSDAEWEEIDREVMARIQMMAAQAGMSPKKAVRILQSVRHT